MNGHPMKIFAMWLKTILMVAALCSFAASANALDNVATLRLDNGGANSADGFDRKRTQSDAD